MGLKSLIIKASRMDLTSGLFEKMLTEEDIEKAKKGIKDDVGEGENKIIKEYSFNEFGEITIRETFHSFKSERNPSNPRKPLPVLYPQKINTRTYTSQGKLKLKHIEEYSLGFKIEETRISFNPAGRRIGKIEY